MVQDKVKVYSQMYLSAKVQPLTLEEAQELSQEEIDNSNKNANTAGQGIYSDPKRGQSTATPLRDANYETTQHSKVYGWRHQVVMQSQWTMVL